MRLQEAAGLFVCIQNPYRHYSVLSYNLHTPFGLKPSVMDIKDRPMNIDFVSAICKEFCEALSDVVLLEALSPQECWEPLINVLGKDVDAKTLADLTNEQIEQLRVAYASWFENDTITTDQIKTGISRTLVRWSPVSGT